MDKKVIALVCAAGMSTSLLVTKMQQAAKKEEKDYLIFAKSTADVDNILAGEGFPIPDVLLLGPQVSFQKKEIFPKTEKAGVPMDVISMQDYGMMRGDKVLEVAEQLMNCPKEGANG